ncbi:hypothetical protein HHK36_004054 [Tetracentron sinense]|uniref:Bifunctional inhibitor/plant lipid transfer protein/seed storage helical domain-containing protein n=1 Tax=Tetracentron sinense TaxID=13715 RepID=A0A834ZZN6_TETSI|nr:hypothetical protein HHK36_004054 [Tetracentron sinense]
MVKVTLVFSGLAMWALVVVNCATSPAPAVDCSTLIFNMADCLSFVSSGSSEAKPQGSCCSGLKTVLKADAECLCEAFKNSAQLGVELNVSKALSLPTACGVSAPPFSNCGLSVSPGAAAPVDPPKSSSPKSAPSPKSHKSSAPVLPPSTPASTGGTTSEAPAPVPRTSDASLASTSFAAVLVSLVIASCSYF